MDLPYADALVAGLVADEAGATGLIAALCAIGLEPRAIHVGASDGARAQMIASSHGLGADLATDDPLAGGPGLANVVDQRRAVDRGGMIGALVGAIAGAVLGVFPIGHFIAANVGGSSVADALLLLVFGGVCGSVLGGAFGPRLSTHAGFRLVDGMDEGRIAVAAACTNEKAAETQALFVTNGATDVIVIN